MEFTVSLSAAGDGVEAVVQLPPNISSSADLVVEVLGNDTLLLQGRSSDHPLHVALPVPIDPDTSRVRFKRATGKLTFTAFAQCPRLTIAPPSSPPTSTCLIAGTDPFSKDRRNDPRATSSFPGLPPSEPLPEVPRAPTSGSASGNRNTSEDGAEKGLKNKLANGFKKELGPRPHESDVEGVAPPWPGSTCVVAAATSPDPHPRSPCTVATSAISGLVLSEDISLEPVASNYVPAGSRIPCSITSGGAIADFASVSGSGAAPYVPAYGDDAISITATTASSSTNAAAAATSSTTAPAAATSSTTKAVNGSSSNGSGEVRQEVRSAPPLLTITATAAAARRAAAEASEENPALAQWSGESIGTSASQDATKDTALAHDGQDTDTELYREFCCNSAPAVSARPPPAAATMDIPDAVHPSMTGAATCWGSGSLNAARVAAAFEPTGGTSSRDTGFSFTAPDLLPPSPLPAGLPAVAPSIDCRYLAVANSLRVSAHVTTAALAEAMGLRQRPSTAVERRSANRVKAILQQVADTLGAYGYAVLDNYISEAAIRGARSELKVMEPHYSSGMIWVGTEAETGAQISVSSVRGDYVLWLDDPALNATAFVKDGVRRPCSFMQLQQMLADVDELVFEGLRSRLPYLAGLHRRSDAMMAVYPGKGARFAKHVDNTTQDGRRLTVLTYLNSGWQERHGGALRLFPVRPGSKEVVDVQPLAGRVALFLSAEVAHEVMPSFAPRHAVTLWYFDAGEHAAALTAAKVLPGSSSRPSARSAATALLRDLLADEASSCVKSTNEGCKEIASRVAALEPGAKKLLAAVLGLPSAAAVVECMQNLTPESLRLRREELRNMGLGSQHHAPDTSAHVSGM